MATMQCEIVSAEKSLFSGTIKKLTAVGTIGGLGIYPGHAPLLTGIRPGPVTLTMENDEDEVFFASGGYIEIQGGFVTILADTATRAEDIDEAQAKEAEEAAERARADMAADVDFSVVAAQIAEARAQQRTVEELRKLKQRI
ncbi:MAG: F0F1 ATP synthase subunit epsilon [Pseudomonadota bacterium]|nr:F0F1 ATP synthase subunit epsilon [Pseudomonadota bacterium]